jgi:secretion/DNA translocation related TadE-like protein
VTGSGPSASEVSASVVVASDGRDRGAATVGAVGAIAVLLSVVLFSLHLGGVMVARHQAESAADLAALAGAGAAVAGEQAACADALRVADRMRVRVLSCRARGWDVLVEVAARPAGRAGIFGEAKGRARAGPLARPPAMIN